MRSLHRGLGGMRKLCITWSVAQGCILDQLLFLLYINDLFKASNSVQSFYLKAFRDIVQQNIELKIFQNG